MVWRMIFRITSYNVCYTKLLRIISLVIIRLPRTLSWVSIAIKACLWGVRGSMNQELIQLLKWILLGNFQIEVCPVWLLSIVYWCNDPSLNQSHWFFCESHSNNCSCLFLPDHFRTFVCISYVGFCSLWNRDRHWRHSSYMQRSSNNFV